MSGIGAYGEQPPEVVVEPWPSGGFAVRIVGHPVPISRHDTEDEARARAEAYVRGLDRASYTATPDDPDAN